MLVLSVLVGGHPCIQPESLPRLLDEHCSPDEGDWKPPGRPPRTMPSDKEWMYTRCGAIETAKMFVDDTWDGKGSHYKHSHEDIVTSVAMWKQILNLPAHARRVRPAMQLLVEALENHGSFVDGERVLVFGSITPDVETLCLAVGAREVVTVEYNNLTNVHPQLRQVTSREFVAGLRRSDPEFSSFGAALSISSFDHDGLGRYGDPCCADGDLVAIDRARAALRPGGVLFLTVPVGPDVVVWNLHRRYGVVRLPLLLEGWGEPIDRVGWDEARLTAAAKFTQSWEPVFVLRKSGGVASNDAVPSSQEL